ncbi:MAG: thiamine protein [Gemmatimonadetes bacterium]|nr:thiamine protein [Gemmatimonadota bacterium]
MAITFALPNALVPYSGGRTKVMLQDRCRTVGDALGALAASHAGIVDRVMDERGEVRQHVNVFVDGENIRFTEGLATPVGDDSTIMIVAAVSGG